MRQADRLFSAFILRTKVCEVCRRRRSKDPAHHISRRFHAVRWSHWNASALCRPCHDAYTLEPAAWRDWYEAKLGERIAHELHATAQRGVQLTEVYMRGVIETLKAA